MKKAEITVPKDHRDSVEEVLESYSEDFSVSDTQIRGEDFIEIKITLESGQIDALTEDLKGITDLDAGDLVIDVFDEKAHLEKGKKVTGGTADLSVQEMYQKAFQFSSLDRTSSLLVALGAGIAVFGVAMENLMVVVGAMVIAPMLGPFISTSFGAVIGDRELIRESVLEAISSIAVGFGSAFLVSLVIPLKPNPLMELIANPGFVTVPLSLFVGSAAALTFATEAREALAGVAVAIALVPPTAVAGASLSIPNISLFLNSSVVVITNVSALILAGSLTFKFYGISPTTYYRKKVSEEKLKKALAISGVSLLLIATALGYLSYIDLKNSQTEAEATTFLQDQLGDRILRMEVSPAGDTVDVDLVVIDPDFTHAELQDLLSNHLDNDVNLRMITVDGGVETGG